MDYANNCEVLIIQKGDFILTINKELLQVVDFCSDCVTVVDGRKIYCNEIIDVKKWEEIQNV